MVDYVGNRYLIIVISLFCALLLSILPLPHWALWCRPQWVLLVLMYWLFYEPSWMRIGWVWLLGLVQDLLMGNLLGQHAFVYVLLAFFVVKLTNILSKLPLWQQLGFILILSILNIVLQNWLIHLFSANTATWMSLWSVMTNLLVWPWMVYLFNPREHISTDIEVFK